MGKAQKLGRGHQRGAMTMAKRKKPKKQAQRTMQPPIQTKSSESEWLASMHEYHRRTGLYRAEDLNRVLGDPRDQVSNPIPEDFALASGIHPAKE